MISNNKFDLLFQQEKYLIFKHEVIPFRGRPPTAGRYTLMQLQFKLPFIAPALNVHTSILVFLGELALLN